MLRICKFPPEDRCFEFCWLRRIASATVGVLGSGGRRLPECLGQRPSSMRLVCYLGYQTREETGRSSRRWSRSDSGGLRKCRKAFATGS